MSKPFVILPRELGQVPPPTSLVGQKARGLSQLLTLKARVPRFGVINAAAFDEFMQLPELRGALPEAKAGLHLEDEASIIAIGERLVHEAMATPLPDAVLDGIAELKRAFADDDVFAIRASVLGEDLEVRALAGQLDAALGTRDVEGCVQRLFAWPTTTSRSSRPPVAARPSPPSASPQARRAAPSVCPTVVPTRRRAAPASSSSAPAACLSCRCWRRRGPSSSSVARCSRR